MRACALILARRHPRRAGLLAAIGPFLFVGPFLGDQLGVFASIRPLFQITVLEIAAMLTQIAILFVAVRLRRQGLSTG